MTSAFVALANAGTQERMKRRTDVTSFEEAE
jgi:hypothetical protein